MLPQSQDSFCWDLVECFCHAASGIWFSDCSKSIGLCSPIVECG